MIARNATPSDDDGERFEFEAGDYLIDNVEARKAARAMLRRSGADVLETTLLEKSLSHLLMLENARGYVYSSGAGNARSAKRR